MYRPVFFNLDDFKKMDFNLQNSSSNKLDGDFWELKSTRLKVTKVEKHCSTPR